MKLHRQLIASTALLALACGTQIAQAETREAAMRQFQAEQSEKIRAQGGNALGDMRRDLKGQLQRQRIAFVNTQRHQITYQSEVALAAIKQEAGKIEPMPVLAWSNSQDALDFWPAIAAAPGMTAKP